MSQCVAHAITATSYTATFFIHHQPVTARIGGVSQVLAKVLDELALHHPKDIDAWWARNVLPGAATMDDGSLEGRLRLYSHPRSSWRHESVTREATTTPLSRTPSQSTPTVVEKSKSVTKKRVSRPTSTASQPADAVEPPTTPHIMQTRKRSSITSIDKVKFMATEEDEIVFEPEELLHCIVCNTNESSQWRHLKVRPICNACYMRERKSSLDEAQESAN